MAPVSPVITVQGNPENASDVYRLLNDHLADVAQPQKRMKSSSDQSEWSEFKPKDSIHETASSHHEEEASLGKRSNSDAGDLRLCGRRKDVGHFLDSIIKLEGVITDIEVDGLMPLEAPYSNNEVTENDEDHP